MTTSTAKSTKKKKKKTKQHFAERRWNYKEKWKSTLFIVWCVSVGWLCTFFSFSLPFFSHFYLLCFVRIIHCSSAIVDVCCSLCCFWLLQCQWNDISISTTTIELLFERALARSLAHISIRKLNIGCHRVHRPSHTSIFLWHRPTFKWKWWWHHEQASRSFFLCSLMLLLFLEKNQWVNKNKSFWQQQTAHVLSYFTPLHRLTQSNSNSNLNLNHQFHVHISVSSIVFVATRAAYFPL